MSQDKCLTCPTHGRILGWGGGITGISQFGIPAVIPPLPWANPDHVPASCGCPGPLPRGNNPSADTASVSILRVSGGSFLPPSFFPFFPNILFMMCHATSAKDFQSSDFFKAISVKHALPFHQPKLLKGADLSAFSCTWGEKASQAEVSVQHIHYLLIASKLHCDLSHR